MDCFCSIGVMPLNMAAGAAFKCDDCKKWWIYNGQDWESRGISAGEQAARLRDRVPSAEAIDSAYLEVRHLPDPPEAMDWLNDDEFELRVIPTFDHAHLAVKLTRFEAKQVVRSLKKRRQMLRGAERRGDVTALEKLIATEAVLSDLQPFVDGE